MQTTYSAEPDIGFPGQPADTGFKDDISRMVEETDGIEPGLVVLRGTDPDTQARLPVTGDSDSSEVLGVSLRSHHAFGSTGDDTYPDSRPMPIRRIGRVKVVCEDAFTPDDAVFFRKETGAGGSQPGQVRTDADTATALAWTSAKFANSGGAGDIAILQILENG